MAQCAIIWLPALYQGKSDIRLRCGGRRTTGALWAVAPVGAGRVGGIVNMTMRPLSHSPRAVFHDPDGVTGPADEGHRSPAFRSVAMRAGPAAGGCRKAARRKPDDVDLSARTSPSSVRAASKYRNCLPSKPIRPPQGLTDHRTLAEGRCHECSNNLPCGSVTGAPKSAAIEALDCSSRTARGLYREMG